MIRPIGAAVATLVAFLVTTPTVASAQQRYALILTGANGGALYAAQYQEWAETLTRTLTTTLKFDPSHIILLSDAENADQASTAANVRRHLTTWKRTLERDDLLFVILIGHGTFDGVDAKFNLVGPDLESAEWASLLRGMPAQLVVVNTAPASFPFLERLKGPRRIIISATDTVAQQFDTVFPEYIIAALADESSDIDKNGRISIWEAFTFAASAVRRHYQQRGQLATERPLIDDDGDGIGREPAGQGSDGSLSSRTYLDEPSPDAAPTDEVLLKLLQKRSALEAEVDDLRVKKTFMQPAEYEAEFERLMIELAKVSRDVRQRRRT
jgi:hypothetical protein